MHVNYTFQIVSTYTGEENIFTGRSFLHCKSNTPGEEIGSDVALSVLQAIVLNLNLPLETFEKRKSCSV